MWIMMQIIIRKFGKDIHALLLFFSFAPPYLHFFLLWLLGKMVSLGDCLRGKQKTGLRDGIHNKDPTFKNNPQVGSRAGKMNTNFTRDRDVFNVHWSKNFLGRFLKLTNPYCFNHYIRQVDHWLFKFLMIVSTRDEKILVSFLISVKGFGFCAKINENNLSTNFLIVNEDFCK